jgi:hypothetical protein
MSEYCDPSKRPYYKNGKSCMTKENIMEILTELKINFVKSKNKAQLSNLLKNELKEKEEYKILKNLQLSNELKDKLKNHVFIPINEYPGAREWISNFGAQDVLKQYSEYKVKKFLLVIPGEEGALTETLKNSFERFWNKNNKGNYVYNRFGLITFTAPNSSHFCCVYYDESLKILEFFDPFGSPPTKDFQAILDYILEKLDCELVINTVQYQKDSYNCGIWCLWYILTRLNNKKLKIPLLETPGRNLLKSFQMDVNELRKEVFLPISKKELKDYKKIYKEIKKDDDDVILVS